MTADEMTRSADTVDPRRVLARHGLHAKKSWGQNFLHDRAVLGRIAAAVGATADDVVVEIGAGLGTLTAALAHASPAPRRILAVERDPDMQRVLAAELAGDARAEGVERVEIVGADALAFDYLAASRAAGRPVVVAGNLPYQISSALVLALVEAGARGAVARAIVMVQREMAQRIVAPPGSRTYGRLTVAVAQHAAARILFHVRPGSFHPAPAVTSSVISLVPRPAPLAPVRDAALFEAVVKQAFATRRKMLRGALGAAFGDAAVAAAFAASGIAGTRRAEELSVPEFARLADALADARVAG
jgi:16S rRNA (adenine1518-N6/adenine1519-N6)-dimethyltransferase